MLLRKTGTKRQKMLIRTVPPTKPSNWPTGHPPLPLPAPLKTLFAHRVFSGSLLRYPSTQPWAIQYPQTLMPVGGKLLLSPLVIGATNLDTRLLTVPLDLT